jgi:hypothetical protein
MDDLEFSKNQMGGESWRYLRHSYVKKKKKKKNKKK